MNLLRAKSLFLSLVSPEFNSQKKTKYQKSPFLRVTKPLIDVCKRAHVEELVRKETSAIEWRAVCLEKEYGNDFYDEVHIEAQTKLRALHDAILAAKKNELRASQARLVEEMQNGWDLFAYMHLAFKSKGYLFENITSDFFIVSKQEAKAMVVVSDANGVNKGFDTAVNEQFIDRVIELSTQYECDASIILSPGNVDPALRKKSKANDIFTLCSWDILQLIAETEQAVARQNNAKAA